MYDPDIPAHEDENRDIHLTVDVLFKLICWLLAFGFCGAFLVGVYRFFLWTWRFP